MYDIQHDSPAPGRHRFVLRPNRSISWQGLCRVYGSLVVVSGVIATGLSLLGFWPILPLAGLELAAVGIGLYLVARRGQVREVISLDPDTVRIERGRHGPDESLTLARTWAQVVLERCPKRWYPSRLLIRAHGQAVEVGSFLNEDERCHLADELVRYLSAPATGQTRLPDA